MKPSLKSFLFCFVFFYVLSVSCPFAISGECLAPMGRQSNAAIAQQCFKFARNVRTLSISRGDLVVETPSLPENVKDYCIVPLGKTNSDAQGLHHSEMVVFVKSKNDRVYAYYFGSAHWLARHEEFILLKDVVSSHPEDNLSLEEIQEIASQAQPKNQAEMLTWELTRLRIGDWLSKAEETLKKVIPAGEPSELPSPVPLESIFYPQSEGLLQARRTDIESDKLKRHRDKLDAQFGWWDKEGVVHRFSGLLHGFTQKLSGLGIKAPDSFLPYLLNSPAYFYKFSVLLRKNDLQKTAQAFFRVVQAMAQGNQLNAHDAALLNKMMRQANAINEKNAIMSPEQMETPVLMSYLFHPLELYPGDEALDSFIDSLARLNSSAKEEILRLIQLCSETIAALSQWDFLHRFEKDGLLPCAMRAFSLKTIPASWEEGQIRAFHEQELYYDLSHAPSSEPPKNFTSILVPYQSLQRLPWMVQVESSSVIVAGPCLVEKTTRDMAPGDPNFERFQIQSSRRLRLTALDTLTHLNHEYERLKTNLPRMSSEPLQVVAQFLGELAKKKAGTATFDFPAILHLGTERPGFPFLDGSTMSREFRLSKDAEATRIKWENEIDRYRERIGSVLQALRTWDDSVLLPRIHQGSVRVLDYDKIMAQAQLPGEEHGEGEGA